MTDEPILKHTYCLNRHDNGGEHLMLYTKFFANGDPNGLYTNQELQLNSYCNSASFNLFSIKLNPESLRELADQLESAENYAKSLLEKKLKETT